MPSQFMYNPLKLSFFLLLIFFLLILSRGSVTAADDDDDGIISIGAIIDDDSREGKEQITAMKIAVQDLNNSSSHKFTLHFSNTSRDDPLQAATAAEQLIKDEKVRVIMGTQTWQEAAVVADIGSRAQVPFISLASAATTPPLAQTRWPFLVQMARNRSNEMQSIAAIVQTYNWKRVIAIYEDDTFSGDYGLLTLLSDELQSVGSQVEHRVVLPPFSLLRDDVEGLIREEVAKLLSKTSRVFIVAHSSLPLANRLFTEAKRIGLMGRDSVWIITDSISSLLDSVEPSIITSMEGVIGTKSYFSEDIRPFLDFKVRFRETFRSDYPGEDNVLPGFHALRAYDSVMVIGRGVTKLGANYNSNSTILLESFLSSNFTGLTGDIHFHDQTLFNSPVFRIINVVGKSYKTLGFWSSELGFSESVDQVNRTHSMTSLTGIGRVVNWPGDLTRVPKGWALPTDAEKLKIGIPGKNAFPKLVTVPDENSKENKYTGFCIEVFYEVVEVLKSKYPLPYEFIPSKSEEMYDMLVEQVINKTVDAVVGDITILANRSEDVEFTMPYAESGLTMLVQVKHDHHKAWMFLRPFTVPMWIVTFGILIYTMCIVWILEHQSNPEFKGLIKDQFSMALWFTFSTLFFAHREKVYNNLTKIVVVVWLFVVLILSSSYTASLSSMLTVPKLEPKVKDIDWIRSNNAPVGCDEDSFVKRYLSDVLKLTNLKTFHKQSEYPEAFNNGSIKAAFLEIPYLKLFMQNYTTGYTAVGPTYRFGGLGFVFQKGSPIARDVSEAILAISENGALKKLEKEWLSPPESTSKNPESEHLTLKSFWGIYVISGATSTVCLLIFLVKLLHNKYYHSENTTTNQENAHLSPSNVTGTWGKAVELVRYLHNKETRISPRKAPSFKHGNEQWSSNSSWELVSPSEMVEHPIRPTQLEIPIRNDAVYIANHVER